MKNVRLSAHIRPERYNLTIKPDLEGFTFEGEERVSLVLKKITSEIILHAKDLKVFDVKFQIPNFKFPTKKVRFNQKDETVSLIFFKPLPKGRGELSLKFTGILNDKMRGFYRSRYEHQGKQKHMAVTQFEATDARRAFPCFDEPSQKAVFDITLIVPKELTAISNTVETSITEHQSGYKVVKFASTPRMSTYLVAFIVGNFESIEGWAKPHRQSPTTPSRFAGHPSLKRRGETQQGTLVRVFVTPGKKHQAKFALDTAIRCLEFYNQYFDIPYPLPVLDLIAVPDFSHGAMENWGAVTYRESALLVDPEHSSAANKQWVALVIAHELAHQWFGNLVTMEWWTHLWLNEGFASYIEYLAVHKLFPAWDIWTQFAYHDLNVALDLDGLKSTHPIEVEVHHPDEIGEIFDEVSYSKGASVIRMLAAYLGEKYFRDGLRYYLKKHSYSNAATVDLWRAFEKVSGRRVREMMRGWTGKPGYPVIKIVEQPKKLQLTQSRFFSSPISKRQAGDSSMWEVPVLVESEKSKVKSWLFSGKKLAIPKPKGLWVKLNPGETGFYRVDYPAQMLLALRSPVKSKKLPAIDRLGLVRDAFGLAEAGALPTVEALALIESYTDETDYTVWVELAGGLASLRNLTFGQKYYPGLEKYCRNVFSKINKRLGWRPVKGESHTTSLLRSLVLSQLIAARDPKVTAEALRIYNNTKNLPPDIRGAVYLAVAKNGGPKEHGELIGRYKTESLSEEKGRLGRALGQFSEPGLLRKSLDFALSKNVRIQDTPGIFMSCFSNPNGREIAWEYTKRNWKMLLKTYPASGHMISRFIKPADHFVTAKDGKDVTAFFKKNSSAGAQRAVAQTLEKIYSNDAWLTRDGEKIGRWLERERNI